MPKEYINYPQPVRVENADGTVGEQLPRGPQVGLHWDGNHGTVQLSIDIDWDLLQRIVDGRRNNPTRYHGEDEDRAVFYTEALDRNDLQRLIKQTRRARDAAFGSDE